MDLESLSKCSKEEILKLGKRGQLENSLGGKVNSSGYPGINWSNRFQKYQSAIVVDQIYHNLGRYDLLKDAVRARLIAEVRYFGRILEERPYKPKLIEEPVTRIGSSRSRIIDLTGKKFPHFTVSDYLGRAGYTSLWHCVCECGNSFVASSSDINLGKVKSCGCRTRKDYTPHLQDHFREIYLENTSLAHITSKKTYKNNKTSKVRGVFKVKRSGSWYAKLTYQGIIHRVRCNTKAEAIQARKRLEREYFLPEIDKHAVLVNRLKRRRKLRDEMKREMIDDWRNDNDRAKS